MLEMYLFGRLCVKQNGQVLEGIDARKVMVVGRQYGRGIVLTPTILASYCHLAHKIGKKEIYTQK